LGEKDITSVGNGGVGGAMLEKETVMNGGYSMLKA